MSLSMICPRDYVLRSRNGHTIRFEAGVATEVPDDLVSDALAMNIVPHERRDDEKPAFGLITSAITGSLRDALVFRAIGELIQQNNHENFDGGGVPKLAALNSATGLSLGGPERVRFYERYRELIGSNSEIPSHPNVDNVLELQAMTTRKQLEEFAADIGFDAKRYKGKPLKELKSQMLSHVINNTSHVALSTGDENNLDED